MLRIGRLFRRFVSDEQGVALILVVIMLPVIIGFAVLAIDMARVNNLHNDLQKGADAFALAGAAELDGNYDAWSRAERAMDKLIDNTTNFSTSGYTHLTAGQPGGNLSCNNAGSISWCFLKSIPSSDKDRITSANYAANAAETSFIQVKLTPASFTTIFPASFLGASGSFSVGAEAVAGYGSAVCDFTPMFICNPYPGSSLQDLADAVSGTSKPMVLLKENAGSGQYGPGNFGYLKAPTDSDPSNKNKDIADMFASTSPKACYGQRGVQTRTGNIANMYHAINTRFDIFDKGGAYKTNPTDNPPAPNVRKGMKVGMDGTNCSYDETTDPGYKALPEDNCFTSGTGDGCTDFTSGGRLGNGEWDFPGYWNVNHPGQSTDGVLAAVKDGGCGANPSRYCVYNYEIDHISQLTSGAEKTAPACNATAQGPDRRLLYVAVIDCVHNEVKGGGGTEYPVQAFASMFLTVPAGGPPDTDIYAELEDITTSYGQGTLKRFERNEAQLYR